MPVHSPSGGHTNEHASTLPRVAFQGALGAFSEQAIRQHWPDGAQARPHRTFGEAIASVLAHDADFAVIPVENAIAGRVASAVDALDAAGAALVHRSDVRVIVRLCLLAPQGATMAGIRSVYSHPMALAQCRIFFARHEWLTPVPHEDTAGAAEEVAGMRDVTRAAVASDAAAERYGLDIIARDVEDVPVNWTRFLIVSAR
ncbi:MAG: prephenate dehydratase domain-containing protein [Gemmatimonadota bacterium]